MYRLYEKVPKSEEYEFGLKLLEESENPFKDGPCVVSMIALAYYEKDINGALNLGMEALRLHTNNNENTGIEMEDFDARILSIAYGEPSGDKSGAISRGKRGESLDDEFAKKYLCPLIEENGRKIDVIQAMKNMRNVNFLTYCGATTSAFRIEQLLKNRMNELGYSEKEISQIQSQMCIICYATNEKLREEFLNKRKIESTCISFGDVNDPDARASQGISENARKNNTIFFDEGYYFHYGDGKHNTKKYIIENTSLSAGISYVLTKAVSNSIANSKSAEFTPITIELLTADIGKIIEGIREGKSRGELMAVVEKGITYGRKALFNEYDIGKSVTPISTTKKDEARSQAQRDEQEKGIENPNNDAKR